MELRHDRADRNSWNRRASVKSNRRHGLTVHLYNRRRCRAPVSNALCAARPAVCLPCLCLRVSAYIAVSLPLSMSVSSISLHRVGVSVLCCVSRSPRCCINLSLNVGHMAKRLSTWPPVFFQQFFTIVLLGSCPVFLVACCTWHYVLGLSSQSSAVALLSSFFSSIELDSSLRHEPTVISTDIRRNVCRIGDAL